jgi:hypothetical protein
VATPTALASLLGVFIATMPYSAVVGTAFAPLVIGVLFIAFSTHQAKAKRNRH